MVPSLSRPGPMVRWLWLILASGGLAACGGDNTGPGSPSSAAGGLTGTVSALGDWNGALPDTTTPAPVELANSTITATNGEALVCSNRQREERRNFDELLMPGATSGVMWPGALIQGASLIAGTPASITLPRSRIAISIDLAVENPQRTIDNPSSASVQAAVAALQREADSRLGPIDVVPARVQYNMTETFGTMQLLTSLGMYAKAGVPAALLGIEVPGTVSAASSSSASGSVSFQRHTISARLVQPMYTISFADESKREPGDYLAASVTPDQVQQAVVRGTIGPDNLPTYVKSVTYGRMIIFNLTNTELATAAELRSSVQAAFDLFKVGSASGGNKLSVRDSALLQNSELTVLAFGGSQDSALNAIRTGQLSDFFTSVPATQAVPLGYRVNYLKNGQVATIGQAARYIDSECAPVEGTQSRIWRITLRGITTNGGCDNPDYLVRSVLQARYGDGVNVFESTYPFFVDSAASTVDTVVNRQIVQQVPLDASPGFALLSVLTEFRPVPVSGEPFCGPGGSTASGSPGTANECLLDREFDGSDQFAVSPYEFSQVITLPGSNSACTATFEYVMSLDAALARAP